MIQNEALTLTPFLGFVATPNDQWFVQSFAQFVIPVSDNSYSYQSINHFDELPGLPPFTLVDRGALNVQSLLHLDVSFGRMLLDNSASNDRLQSIAALFEIHYTTTLEDSDNVSFTDPNFQTHPVFNPQGVVDGNLGSLGNPAGRQDFLNLTFGVDVALFATNIRPAFVLPIRTGDDKQFDCEFTLQVNRHF